MQLFFIRHAQSENNLLLEQTGSNDVRCVDPELTHLGYQQAQVLAEFLGRSQSVVKMNRASASQNIQAIQLTHLYTSLMIRAVATGVEISKTTGLPLMGWLDLHELGGIYQKNPQTGMKAGLPGHSKAYFEQRYPELILPDSVGEQGWWNRPHEPNQQGLSRARCVLQELYTRHGGSNDRVGLISHGDFYQMFLPVIFGQTPENLPFFQLNNAAITRIDLEANKIRVMYLNRMDYIPANLIT
ncbi:MAG TPA: histidine phosphatase family protein [Anaerolineaceae bacterium]|nr:histidine phosphatase family protein [Anaerolineaceae bacterium]